jgi:hypothetical protein
MTLPNDVSRTVDRLGRRAWPGARVALDAIMDAPAPRTLPVGWMAAAMVAVLLIAGPLLVIYSGGAAKLAQRVGRPATPVAGSPTPSPAGTAQPLVPSSPGVGSLASPLPVPVPTAPPVGPSAAPTARPSAAPAASPAGAECASNELTVQATTDKAAYTVGQSVTITLTVTNVSSRSCWVPVGGCATDMFEVFDASGTLVWAGFENSSQVCASAQEQHQTLDRGASLSRTSAWAQQECSNPNTGCTAPTLAPRGTYSAGGFWASSDRQVVAGRRQFMLN